MIKLIKTLATVAAAVALATGASAQTRKHAHDASPYIAIDNEPAPKLFVDPPAKDFLAQGLVLLQYRVENVRLLPVFGEAALDVSPRLGHLHINVDDLPYAPRLLSKLVSTRIANGRM